MRKRIHQQEPPTAPAIDERWLDLASIAQVEVTSEDPEYPIENAFLPGATGGWKAASPGTHTIKLLFDIPLQIAVVELFFVEENAARTQQFTLSWRSHKDGPAQEIVRQQYNFSLPNSTREKETYQVNLDGVWELELELVPDISRDGTFATLASLRVQ